MDQYRDPISKQYSENKSVALKGEKLPFFDIMHHAGKMHIIEYICTDSEKKIDIRQNMTKIQPPKVIAVLGYEQLINSTKTT